jgi:hypothetical protein
VHNNIYQKLCNIAAWLLLNCGGGDEVAKEDTNKGQNPETKTEAEKEQNQKVVTSSSKPWKPAKPKKPLGKKIKFYTYLSIFLFFIFAAALISLPVWKHKLPSSLQKFLPETKTTENANVDMANLQSQINDLSDMVKLLGMGQGGNYDTAIEDASQTKADIEKLNNTIDAMEQRIAELEGKVSTLKAISSSVKAVKEGNSINQKSAEATFVSMSEKLSEELQKELSKQMNDNMNASVEELKNDLSAKADKVTVDARYESLSLQLAEVEKIASSNLGMSEASSAMVIASVKLKDDVTSGTPFIDALKEFKEILDTKGSFKQDKTSILISLKELNKNAKSGIPSIESLRKEFDETAKDAIVKGMSSDGDGWTADAINKVKSMVVIRKTKKATKGSVDEIVYRASNLLRDGKVEETVSAINEIKNTNAKAVFDDWLEKANKRIDAISYASSIMENCVSSSSSDNKEEQTQEQEAQPSQKNEEPS